MVRLEPIVRLQLITIWNRLVITFGRWRDWGPMTNQRPLHRRIVRPGVVLARDKSSCRVPHLAVRILPHTLAPLSIPFFLEFLPQTQLFHSRKFPHVGAAIGVGHYSLEVE